MKEFEEYDILLDITRLAGYKKAVVEQVGFVAIFEGDLLVFATHRLSSRKQ